MFVPHFHEEEEAAMWLCSHLFYGSYCDHKEQRQAAGYWGSWRIYH